MVRTMTDDEIMLLALVVGLGLPVVLGSIYMVRSLCLKKN